MIVAIDAQDVKSGVLGLVVALIEIIKEALQLQALRRMEGGSLAEEEMERLGEALIELDAAIEQIKLETGVAAAVKALRDGLDRTVDRVLDQLVDPPDGDKRTLA